MELVCGPCAEVDFAAHGICISGRNSHLPQQLHRSRQQMVVGQALGNLAHHQGTYGDQDMAA